ncbi:hypothetical protein BC830DRAFT_215522 [Chytriomyces sp. MP71]|nr:hypothetical protein BC830DRAFT_215522 [Chytriomyces sp. MP71]
MADFKKREDELRRREAALEAREAALSVREEEVRRLLHDVETGKEGGGSSARRLSEELAAAIGGNSSLVGSTLEGGLAEGSTLRDEELVRIGSVDDLTRHVSFMQQLSRQESGVAPPRATITQQSRFAPTVQPFVRNPSALPIATHAAAISAAPTSPSPFRRGIQLRAPQQPHVYANSGLNPSSNENRPQASGAPLDKNLQRVASVGGFRAAGGVMTPTKKGTNVYELPSSPASPMQLSSP